MKYLLVIDGFGRFAEFSKYARLFNSTDKAKRYVSDLHEESWDYQKGEFKDGIEWDGALLFQVNKDGSLTLISQYDTADNGKTGEAVGWVRICNEQLSETTAKAAHVIWSAQTE